MADGVRLTLCKFWLAYAFPLLALVAGLVKPTIPSLWYFLSFLLFFGLPSVRQRIRIGTHVIYPPYQSFFLLNNLLAAGFLLTRSIIYSTLVHQVEVPKGVADMFGVDNHGTVLAWAIIPDITIWVVSVVCMVALRFVSSESQSRMGMGIGLGSAAEASATYYSRLSTYSRLASPSLVEQDSNVDDQVLA
jgi:hypothetical protein